MSKWSQLLRLSLWIFVSWHGWFWWRDTLPFWAIIITIFISFSLALSLIRHRKHPRYIKRVSWLALFVIAGLAFLPRWIDHLTMPPLFAQLASEAIITPLGLLFVIMLALHWATLRFATWHRYEILIRLGVLAIFTWPQHGYQLIYYPQVLVLIAMLSLYFTTELTLLSLAHYTQLTWPKRITSTLITWVLIVIVLLLPLPYVNKHLMKNNSGLLQSHLDGWSLSDTLSLESEIKLDNRLLFLFDLNQKIQEPLYIKHGFMADYDSQNGFTGLETRIAAPDTSQPQLSHVVQNYYFTALKAKSPLGLPEVVNIQTHTSWPRSFKYAMQVQSALYPALNEEGYQAGIVYNNPPQLLDNEIQRYTAHEHNEKLLQLALDIVGKEQKPYRQAALIEQYLKQNYSYSLRTDAKVGKHALQDFLFKTKKGYCSYFATSMALLARHLQLPTRIAVGFLVYPEEKFVDYYPVYAKNAHAWVEVYIEGAGWQKFDPTSTQIAADSIDQFQYTTDNDALYALVETLLKYKMSLPNDHTSLQMTPTTVLGTDYNHVLWVVISLILIISYIVLIIMSHQRWQPTLQKSARQQTLDYTQYLALKHRILTRQSLTPLQYAHYYSTLLPLYRKAVFAPDFVSSDWLQYRTLAHDVSMHMTRSYKFAWLAYWHPLWLIGPKKVKL
jgi:hypothetical protein